MTLKSPVMHHSTPRTVRFPSGSKKRRLQGASHLFKERIKMMLKQWEREEKERTDVVKEV